MHIAYVADNNYAQHLGVNIASLLTNLGPGIEPHIHVVTEGINEDIRQKILELNKIRKFSIDYVPVSAEDFKQYPSMGNHVSVASYFRLMLPYLLPQLDKVVYLDIDTIIDRDVSPLWDIQFNDQEWAAAAIELEVPKGFTSTIGMKESDLYFNAGIMVMNLAALRENDFEGKCVAFVQKYRDAITYLDQDILNGVCNGHIKLIDLKYNMNLSHHYHIHKIDNYTNQYPLNVVREAFENPVIIHYNGVYKPWYYKCRNSFAYKYKHYLKLTPWKNYHYPDKNFKNFISKNMFFIRQWIKRNFGKAA